MIAPVIRMSSTHQPSSSSRLWVQVKFSDSYVSAVGLNSHDWAIQRMRTRCPRNCDRSNLLTTQLPLPVAPGLPGPGHFIVVEWSHCQPQFDQTPCGQHIVSLTPRGPGGPASVGVRLQ